MKGLRGIARFSIRAVVSALLLIWLFSRIDAKRVLHSFSLIPFEAWALAFFLYISSQVISSLRWYVIVKTLGFKRSFLTILKYYFVGMYFNLFLPTAIGGDVLKVFFLARGGESKLRAGYSIFSDRVFGFWAMFILGGITCLIHPGLLPGKWQFLLVAIFFSSTFLAIFAPVLRRILKVLSRGLVKKSELFKAIFEKIEALLIFWKHPAILFKALFLSITLQLCGMYGAYLLGKGLLIPLDFDYYLAVIPLISVLTIIPISVSGIGLREGGFAFFFGIRNVPMEKAITLSLGVFAIQALSALLGGIFYILGAHKEVEKGEKALKK